MLTGTTTKAIGLMIRHMVMVSTSTRMAPSTKEGGSRINSTVSARRFGLTMLATKDSIHSERRKGAASSTGVMGRPTKANLKVIILKELEIILGLIKDAIMDNG
jgi:hypothetical protein